MQSFVLIHSLVLNNFHRIIVYIIDHKLIFSKSSVTTYRFGFTAVEMNKVGLSLDWLVLMVVLVKVVHGPMYELNEACRVKGKRYFNTQLKHTLSFRNLLGTSCRKTLKFNRACVAQPIFDECRYVWNFNFHPLSTVVLNAFSDSSIVWIKNVWMAFIGGWQLLV